MSYTSPITIMAAMKTRLEQIPLNEGGHLADGALFELVAYYDTPDMGPALQALMATQNQRVLLIVPVGNSYNNSRDRLQLTSRRFARFDLLMGDRDYDQAAQDALVGGDHNVGIMAMEHRVVDTLVGTPLPDLPDVQIEPEDSAPIELSENENTPGRLAVALSISTRAGLKTVAVP